MAVLAKSRQDRNYLVFARIVINTTTPSPDRDALPDLSSSQRPPRPPKEAKTFEMGTSQLTLPISPEFSSRERIAVRHLSLLLQYLSEDRAF